MEHSESLSAWQNLRAEAGKSYSVEALPEAAIVIVTKGSLEVIVEGVRYTVGKDELFLLPPGKACYGMVLEELCVIVVRFLPEMLSARFPEGYVVDITGKTLNGLCLLKANHTLRCFLDLLDHYLMLDVASESMHDLKFQEFFMLLFATYSKDILNPFLLQLMDKKGGFHYFVVRNWKKAHNVEDLAAMANLSTSGFIKKFKRCFNESPYHWMMSRKAECVFEEVVAGRIPLKEIADKYHFANYAHFGSFCKTKYGRSPKELWHGGKTGVLHECKTKLISGKTSQL